MPRPADDDAESKLLAAIKQLSRQVEDQAEKQQLLAAQVESLAERGERGGQRGHSFTSHYSSESGSESDDSTTTYDSLASTAPSVEGKLHVRVPVDIGFCGANGAARHADAILIAPCTANVLAKLAHGFADDVLTSTVLACDKPVIVAPAMNTKMWENAATRDNVALLKERGVHVLDVGEGDLACGEVGAGRLLEVERIIGAVEAILSG